MSPARRRRAALLAGLVLAASLAGGAPPARAIGAKLVAGGLAFPAAFAFFPDGRILYGERFSGELRIFNPRLGSDRLYFQLPAISTVGEQGLLGVAVHPKYPERPFVYAYYTRLVLGIPKNRIVRLETVNRNGANLRTIFRVSAATNHNGGAIHFGPGNRLFAVVGENGNPANSQDLGTSLGKVVRMTPGGGIPADNPFPGSYVYAYGLRNSFGFDWDPETNVLWLLDNGPACNDELDRVPRGANLAWGPSQTCSTPPEPPLNTNQDGPDPVLPKRFYTPPIAPTGAAFCWGCGLGAGNGGRLFFGAWNTGEIRRVRLTDNRRGVVRQRVVYDHPAGILAVEAAPDGTLHFSDPSGIYQLTA